MKNKIKKICFMEGKSFDFLFKMAKFVKTIDFELLQMYNISNLNLKV